MKIAKMILPVALLFVLLTGCKKHIFNSVKGKGPNVTEVRQLTGFNKVLLEIDADIVYVQDANYFVEISAQQNVLDVMDLHVSAGELQIEFSKWVRKHNPITITIHAPDMRGLHLSGSGNINIPGTLNTSYLDIRVSGSGNINVDSLVTEELEATISGSGNMTVDGGSVNNQKVTISGSGNIDLLDLQSNNANCKISGSGDISVWVENHLDATISGSGNIRYRGSATVSTHISGSGSVIHI